MNWLKSKKIIATHSGRFHADDVFAIALLRMVPEWKSAKLIRTRDEEIIKKADLVVDVGTIYDPAQNRFDHHQTGGAGKYENGVPYSGFGLVWKQFGEKVCGSKEVAQIITEKLVQPIDAIDNGVSVVSSSVVGFSEYVMDDMVDAFNPSWKEGDYDRDKAFNEAVKIASRVLEREIKKAQDKLEAKVLVDKAYRESANKKIIILERYLPGQEILMNYPEPVFVIHPHTVPGTWAVKVISAEKGTFKARKDLPKAWAGKRNEELAKLSGVADAHFCHNALYIAVARSKEGAIKMAEIALKNN
jgi:uncharacterized UPF0160 family protein